jgi:hypothetical protein
MTLPRDIGTYRIIRAAELTDEQRAVLRLAGRERVLERLCVLVGEGRVSLSKVQAKYGALLAEVADA